MVWRNKISLIVLLALTLKNTMNRTLLTFLILLFFNQTYSQEKTDVLLLATYHFTNTDKFGDILNSKKQKEIEKFLNKLKTFQPQKIYVENTPKKQSFWDSIYINYKNGQNQKIRNEIFQIGIQLAKKVNLKSGVTCVDWQRRPANTFQQKAYLKYLDKMIKYDDSISKNNVTENSKYIKQTQDYFDDIYAKIPNMSLNNIFGIFNSDKFLSNIFYSNISSYLDNDLNKTGVVWTQNNMIRNVNIYKNIIQDILKTKPKRVIILYGAGHIKALKNYLETHPEINIIETKNYLN